MTGRHYLAQIYQVFWHFLWKINKLKSLKVANLKDEGGCEGGVEYGDEGGDEDGDEVGDEGSDEGWRIDSDLMTDRLTNGHLWL